MAIFKPGNRLGMIAIVIDELLGTIKLGQLKPTELSPPISTEHGGGAPNGSRVHSAVVQETKATKEDGSGTPDRTLHDPERE